MFDFTAVTTSTLTFTNGFMGLVDPTTIIGGLIALASVGFIGVGLVGFVFRRLVRR